MIRFFGFKKIVDCFGVKVIDKINDFFVHTAHLFVHTAHFLKRQLGRCAHENDLYL
jgi:hypothetical protein